MMLRASLLLLSVSTAQAWAADTPAPGGKGRYTHAYQCLETGNRLITQVCADLTFHYELSAFMGEPLAHFGLEWRLRDFTVAGGKAFDAREARELFGGAVDKIELMVQGLAEVRTPGDALDAAIAADARRHLWPRQGYLVVDLDSGVATRAGKMSWNIAGSPDWGKFMMFPMGGECVGAGGGNGTNTGLREFVQPATAKAVMKAGNLELRARGVCNKGTLVGELEPLAAALQAYCQSKRGPKGFANTPYTWCPESPGASANLTEMLDGAASQPLVEAKLKQLRARHLEKVEGQCASEWQRINACYTAGQCTPKSEDDIRQCQVKACGGRPAERVCDEPLSCKPSNEPTKPGWGRLCLPTYCNGNYVDNPKFNDWKRCADDAVHCRVSDACVVRCNPRGYANAARCVQSNQAHGAPTEADARALVEQAQKAPRERPKSKPTEFLD